MIKTYIKIAFRNILRYKANSAFNLLGLSLGIVCTLLLTLHIKEELSYDKVFPKHDRLYRMVTTEWAKSAPPLAAELKNFFPEISATTRFVQRGTNVVNTSFDTQSEIDGLYTDSSVVQMFDLKTVSGNPFQALKEPSSVVLSKSMSVRLFGNKNPVGQKLVFEDEEELWVKAVIEDLPKNTHLKFDYLVSMPTFYAFIAKALPGWIDNKGWMFGWTYIQLNQPADIEKINARLKDFYLKYLDGLIGKEEALSFAQSARIQPITDIHLKSDLIQEMSPNGNITYIYIFIAVEVLILLIACVNFINLFTVQAIKRLKEIGIRKIVGAEKRQISLQFLIQAFVLTLLSVIIALAIYQIAIPFYNNLTGRAITFHEVLKKENILIILLITCFVGFISGLFPSVFASSFLPIKALKATKDPKTSAIYVRKSLVVFQFVISGLLITCTLLIYQQMQLFKN
ncbi:MAG TPA: ABC transporter permease, partial [Pseudosphingobacterium sp.]|nr:ABC transporter permease [Pseudosphingobacterium sp.]